MSRPRKDGSEPGDERLHYECGLPWDEHTRLLPKNEKEWQVVCPDEMPQYASSLRLPARPNYGPFDQDVEELRWARHDDPSADDEPYERWEEGNSWE